MSLSTPTSKLPPISPLGLALAERERRRRRKARHLADLQKDPIAFAAACGFPNLDPWQQQALASEAQTLLLVCGRQVGKSTVTALAVVRELLKPGAMIALISASERQARELFRKVLAAFRHLGKPVPLVRITTVSMELANGARLEVFPASSETIRGLSAVTLLAVDESGVVVDPLYFAVSPMLAVSGGRMIALGSPMGQRGWWYSLWTQENDPDIERIQISSYACPRIARAFLDREAGRIGSWWMQSEFGLPDGSGPIFQESATAAFREADLQSALSDDLFDTALMAP